MRDPFALDVVLALVVLGLVLRCVVLVGVCVGVPLRELAQHLVGKDLRERILEARERIGVGVERLVHSRASRAVRSGSTRRAAIHCSSSFLQ